MVLTHQALQLGFEPALRAPSRHQETISVVKMAPIKSRREERDAGEENRMLTFLQLGPHVNFPRSLSHFHWIKIKCVNMRS